MSAREEGARQTRRARTCPSRSPETKVRCILEDTWRAHRAGHESERVNGGRALWAKRIEDWPRWTDEPEALAEYVAFLDGEHGAHGKTRKRAVRGCPSCIDADRVTLLLAALRAQDADGTAVTHDSTLRFVLAADDLRSPFANGGLLLTMTPDNQINFGPPSAGFAQAIADEAALLARRQRNQR